MGWYFVEYKYLVSLIIPVYNGEDFVSQMFNALDKQHFRDFQVIVIDDGSTDNTWKVLQAYQSDNIKVIRQTNQGVSAARNVGLRFAQGKYVLFPDMDDYLMPNYIDHMVQQLEQSGGEMAICGYSEYGNTSRNSYQYIPEETSYRSMATFISDMLVYKKIGSSLWNKIFLLRIIKKNNLYFDDNIQIGEDLLFILQYLNYVNQVTTVQAVLYKYYVNPVSAMNLSNVSTKFKRTWLTEWLVLKKATPIISSITPSIPLQFRYKQVRVASKLLKLIKQFHYDAGSLKLEMRHVIRTYFIKYLFCSRDSLRMKARVSKRLLYLLKG